MRLKLLIPILFIICSSELIAKSNLEIGISYFNDRADNAVGIIAPEENINKAISAFKSAFNTKDEATAVKYYLQSIYYKSTYCYEEGDKRRKIILSEGKNTGLQMLKKHPNSAQIHYWYAVLLGSWAKESGIISAAKEGVIDKLKFECEKVIELDDQYNDGCGYLFLGILHLEAPYIPFFLTWPNNKTAVDLMRKSLKNNPNHVSNQYYLAKALNEIGEKEEAINILEKATKQTPKSDRFLEETSELDLCKSLLRDLKK